MLVFTQDGTRSMSKINIEVSQERDRRNLSVRSAPGGPLPLFKTTDARAAAKMYRRRIKLFTLPLPALSFCARLLPFMRAVPAKLFYGLLCLVK